MTSKIEWTNATWNPIAGCSPVSEGCRNCYAAREALRMSGNPHASIARKYEGTAEIRGTGRARRAVFTGRINVADRKTLDAPLSWRKPRLVFVNSMSDLFHEDVPEELIVEVWARMGLRNIHSGARSVFQILTKRPERMREIVSRLDRERVVESAIEAAIAKWGPLLGGRFDEQWKEQNGPYIRADFEEWPLPNVWLGTSVEDQAAANERIPHLLRAPAAVRFLSCEPLLGPVDLTSLLEGHLDALAGDMKTAAGEIYAGGRGIDWVIAGGESGPGARPVHPDWIRRLRDDCEASAVPFFFKQWGAWKSIYPAWGPGSPRAPVLLGDHEQWLNLAGGQGMHGEGTVKVRRVGKKAAGRELDGRTWDEMPAVAS